MRATGLTALLATLMPLLAAPALAQAQDVSPVLMIESLPSDNADYRRMVTVRYLSGDRVTAAYKAYNRTEFIQIPTDLPPGEAASCSAGAASTLSEIQAFERMEAEQARTRQAPQPRRFCIKGVTGWEAGNRTTWLDPIFNGMPHAAILNENSG